LSPGESSSATTAPIDRFVISQFAVNRAADVGLESAGRLLGGDEAAGTTATAGRPDRR
jgi:hypothetical protein